MTTNLVPLPPHPLTLHDDLVDAWLLAERQNGAALTTIATYRRGIRRYIAWAAEQGIAGRPVVASDILAYKAFLAENYSPASANLYLSAVRSFYRWAVAYDRIPFSPAAQVKGVKNPTGHRHKRDALTPGEIRAVLATCDLSTPIGIRDRAMLTLLAYCALREVELQRANIGNLTTQGDRVVLQVHGKGRLEADEIVVVPLSQEAHLRAWLSQRLKILPRGAGDPLFVSLSRRNVGSRLSTRAIRGIVKERFATAGVAGIRKTTHSLRHTAITTALRANADPLKVRQMARHSSFDTTLRYHHEAERIDHPAEDLIEY